MTSVVLVDTDVLIDAGRKVAEAVTSLAQIEQQAVLATSAITYLELLVGCQNKAEQHAVERFLRRFQIIPVNQQISDRALDLVRTYRLSHGLLIADALIAATAIVVNEPLLTKNQRDYRFIAGLQLLPYPYVQPVP